MAAPAVAGTPTSAIQTGGASVTVNKPSGTVSGDVLYAWILVYDNNSATPSSTGWTQIAGPTRTTGNIIGASLFRKVAGGSEPANYTWSWSGNNYADGIIVRVASADTTTPEDGSATSNSGNSGTTRTGTGLTTSAADRLLLLFTAGYGGAPNSTPTGMTEVLIQDGVNGVWRQDIASAGATGDKSHTQNASDSWVAHMVAVAPAAGGASTGSVSATLGGLTSSANGQLALSGSLSATLGAVTLAGSGQLALSASLSATLGAVALSATGGADAGISGSLSATLGAAALSSAGALAVSGSLGSSLGAATLSSAGQLALSGSVSATLGTLTLSATGQLAISASLSATLSPATLSAFGGAPGAGAGAVTATLGTLTLSAAGGELWRAAPDPAAPGWSSAPGPGSDSWSNAINTNPASWS